MQNKPNFRNDKMNINIDTTSNYKEFDPLGVSKNKANSNPIQTQFNPKQTQFNPIQSQFKPNFYSCHRGSEQMFMSKTVKILVPTAENKYGLWPDAEIRKNC
ncbi:MAG: hypothetical protein H8D56_22860 [Planctomycetes bacterium]|nr:hypothetical protein [Planctomycetota bacterium]MBL7145146.1 hypothetical protein [Phycisphaerae bacterium]